VAVQEELVKGSVGFSPSGEIVGFTFSDIPCVL